LLADIWTDMDSCSF